MDAVRGNQMEGVDYKLLQLRNRLEIRRCIVKPDKHAVNGFQEILGSCVEALLESRVHEYSSACLENCTGSIP
jgi:hypothetical protein